MSAQQETSRFALLRWHNYGIIIGSCCLIAETSATTITKKLFPVFIQTKCMILINLSEHAIR